MIDLKCCTVLVNNKAEYIALIKEAQKQGFTWADGTALTNIFCDFPTRLRFNGECKVYYNSSAYYYNRDYKCKEIVGALRNMILKRKEGQLC
jgi:hypothetical protein